MNQSTQTPPSIGTYWLNQGGIYLGIVRDGAECYHLIMSETAFSGEWGEYGNEIDGEFSRSNGAHNTALILAAEPDNELCRAITAHQADGHSDFYMPAAFENNLICINARDHIEKLWHWSSTQDVALSAWCQDFGDGCQSVDLKDDGFAVRAVRRLPI